MFITRYEKGVNLKNNEALDKYAIPSEMATFNYIPIIAH